MHKLFVSGFPLEILELELAQLIAPHGDIATIKIVRDRKTRICKGYAFVEMQTADGAQNTINALHGVEMGERMLTVKLSEEKTQALAKQYRPISRNFAARPSATFSGDRPKRPRRTV